MIFLELFWSFFKTGLFTFGGGYAMLPLIQSEVLAHGWLSAEEIVNFIAVSESTPGPFAVNISTYVGRVTAGIGGAVCATLGVVLPSFLVILAVARFYERFKRSRIVEGAMIGLRPAVVGLIAAALLSLGRGVFTRAASEGWLPLLASAAIFLLSAVLAFRKKHPILIIGLSAALGIGAGFALGL
ncbi:MAG: chromate transporter [Clostridia bacterium]|nr:chromate transporter [Clostridia bacterium]